MSWLILLLFAIPASATDFSRQIEEAVAKDLEVLIDSRAGVEVHREKRSETESSTTFAIRMPEGVTLHSLQIIYRLFGPIEKAPMQLVFDHETLNLTSRWEQWITSPFWLGQPNAELTTQVVDAIVFFAMFGMGYENRGLERADSGWRNFHNRLRNSARAARSWFEKRWQATGFAPRKQPLPFEYGQTVLELNQTPLMLIPASAWTLPHPANRVSKTETVQHIESLGERGESAIDEYRKFVNEHGPVHAGVSISSDSGDLMIMTRKLIHVSASHYADNEIHRNLARAKRIEFQAARRAYYATLRMAQQLGAADLASPAIGFEDGILSPAESLIALQSALAEFDQPITVHIALPVDSALFNETVRNISSWSYTRTIARRFQSAQFDRCESYLNPL